MKRQTFRVRGIVESNSWWMERSAKVGVSASD